MQAHYFQFRSQVSYVATFSNTVSSVSATFYQPVDSFGAQALDSKVFVVTCVNADRFDCASLSCVSTPVIIKARRLGINHVASDETATVRIPDPLRCFVDDLARVILLGRREDAYEISVIRRPFHMHA